MLTSSLTPAGREIKLDVSIEFETEREFEIVSSVAVDTSSPGAGPSHAPPAAPSDSIPTTLTHLPPLLITVVLPPPLSRRDLRFPVFPEFRGLLPLGPFLSGGLLLSLCDKIDGATG